MKALVDACFGALITVVGNPDLVYQEDVVTIQPALLDSLAYTLFVAISLCSIHHAVTNRESVADATLSLIGTNLKNTIADDRHLYTIVQFNCVHNPIFCSLLFSVAKLVIFSNGVFTKKAVPFTFCS